MNQWVKIKVDKKAKPVLFTEEKSEDVSKVMR